MLILCATSRGQIVGAVNLVADITALKGDGAGNSGKQHAARARSAAVAMIDIALSVLTLMKWDNVSFDQMSAS
jgi:hypothetical protein